MNTSRVLGLSAIGGLTRDRFASKSALLPILLVAGGMFITGSSSALDLTITPGTTQIFSPNTTTITLSPTTVGNSLDFANINGGSPSTRGGSLVIGGSDGVTITAGTVFTLANTTGDMLLTALTLQGGQGAAATGGGAGGAGGAFTAATFAGVTNASTLNLLTGDGKAGIDGVDNAGGAGGAIAASTFQGLVTGAVNVGTGAGAIGGNG
ncbi:MAG: hypothetical protein HQL59_11665, partial [Magnetococcales bacterium]|nr:hypothetical protein [Magnetococcales bacterium]